ncbi:MAG: extracellular solute-binding protein [Paenibacillaceae bacterium]|nr:extracellular solute-binding protein [Paenibacillaceae bacterium]
MSKKAVVAASIVSLFLASALAGCTKDTKETKDTKSSAPVVSTAPSTAASPSAAPKSYDIKILSGRTTPNADADNLKAINQKLGHKLIFTGAPDAEMSQKLNLMYAANDLPDVFVNSTGDSEILKNASAKFTEDDFKKYMPNMYALALKQYQAAGLTKEQVFNRFTVNGKLAGLFIGQPSTSYPYGLVIRQDVVNELGLKTPQTIDDWEALFKAYKAKYPNKFPVNARGKDAFQQSFYFVLAAYGVNFDTWQLKDGKLVYSTFMPEMREALATVNKWYKAGYINPEWITMDNAAINNEWIAGNSIVYQYAALNHKLAAPFDPGSIWEQTTTKNPQAKMEWVAFPKAKPNVKPAVGTYELILNQPLEFGKHLEKDPDKLHAIMGVVDKLKTDKELNMMQNFGALGKTYDMIDGLPVTKKEFTTADAQVKEALALILPGGQNWDFWKTVYQPNFIENLKKYAEDATGLYSKTNVDWNFTRVNGPLVTPSGEDLTARAKTKLEEYKQLFAQVAIGTKSLDDFDKYIEQYKKEIGNDMTEAANRLYLKQWQ